jgi:hypothetical protein
MTRWIDLTFLLRNSLINVCKVGVLLVRQVLESSSIQLIRRNRPPLGPDFVLLLVLPFESVSEENEEQELEAVANQDRTDSELISWGLVLFIKEWSGDVTDTSSHPDHTRDNHFLGLPTDVRSDQGQGKN